MTVFIIQEKDMIMTDKEKKLLLELISNEQIHMIIKDHNKYESDKYKMLEKLKSNRLAIPLALADG